MSGLTSLITLLMLVPAKLAAMILFLRRPETRDTLSLAGAIALVAFGLPAARWTVQDAFIPRPGVDHGDWCAAIPELVDVTALTIEVVLILAAR